jgi:hypothetical protein
LIELWFILLIISWEVKQVVLFLRWSTLLFCIILEIKREKVLLDLLFRTRLRLFLLLRCLYVFKVKQIFVYNMRVKLFCCFCFGLLILIKLYIVLLRNLIRMRLSKFGCNFININRLRSLIFVTRWLSRFVFIFFIKIRIWVWIIKRRFWFLAYTRLLVNHTKVKHLLRPLYVIDLVSI